MAAALRRTVNPAAAQTSELFLEILVDVFTLQTLHSSSVPAGAGRRCLLQCVAVCCSVLQRVVVCCSVLQRVAVCCSVVQRVAACCSEFVRCVYKGLHMKDFCTCDCPESIGTFFHGPFILYNSHEHDFSHSCIPDSIYGCN